MTTSAGGRAPASASATVILDLGLGGISAGISGGLHRSSSSLTNLTLNALTSADLDRPPVTPDNSASAVQAMQGLSFAWSCSELSPDFGAPCPAVVALSRTVNISVLAGVLPPKIFNFSVVVSKLADPRITSGAYTLVEVTDEPLPAVDIASLRGPEGVFKYNVDNKIVINSTISFPTGTTVFANWTVDELSDAMLKDAVLTPTNAVLTQGGTIPFQLGFRSNGLLPGATYTLKLTASYGGYPQTKPGTGGRGLGVGLGLAFAAITIVTNKPPVGGSLLVEPEAGTALSTTFHIRTTGWSDDVSNYPLTFAMSYYTLSQSQQIMLKPFNTMAYTSAFLSEGFASKNFSVICVVRAANRFDGISQVTKNAIVKPLTNSSALASVMDSKISLAFQTSDMGLVGQVISAVAASINRVDCSGSPACSTLHRQPCSLTANTCGDCLSGYIGVPGQDNSACLEANTGQQMLKTRRLGAVTAVVESRRQLGGGGTCAGPNDCRAFQQCINATCVVVDKSCPNRCGGIASSNSTNSVKGSKGKCVFYDLNGKRAASCAVTDFFCFARCECNAGFYGRDCSLTRSEFVQLRSIRQALCSNIYKTVTLQDVTSDVISSLSVQISSALTDFTQMTNTSSRICATALTDTVRRYAAISSREPTAGTVLQALSVVLGLGPLLGHTVSADVMLAITALAR